MYKLEIINKQASTANVMIIPKTTESSFSPKIENYLQHITFRKEISKKIIKKIN